ncbi:MAG: hypothetical protein ACJAS4_000336 [Bacteriovoracaceae bacterium]|jgi:hypothetical protein
MHEFIVHLAPRSLRKRMMTCEEVSKILANNDKLSIPLIFKLKIHLFICQCCTDYSKQIKTIEEQTHKMGKVELTPQQLESVKNSQKKIIDSLIK